MGHMATWTTVVDGLGFAEGAMVLPDGSAWCVDVAAGTVVRVDTAGVSNIVCAVPGAINALAVGPDGRVFGADNGGMRPDGDTWRQVDAPDGHIAVLDACGAAARFDQGPPGPAPHRLNDLCFDRSGHLYVTDSGNWEALFAETGRASDYRGGSVLLCDRDGTMRLVLEVAGFPNGIAVRPDTGSVVVAHTLTASVWEHEASSDGSLGDGRELVDLSAIAADFGPDGLCLLDDGSMVVAGNRADAVARVSHTGEIVDVLRTPAGWGPTNVAIEPGRLWVTMGRGGRLCSLEVPWAPLQGTGAFR